MFCLVLLLCTQQQRGRTRTFLACINCNNLVRIFCLDLRFDAFLDVCLIPRGVGIDRELVRLPRKLTKAELRELTGHFLVEVPLFDIRIASPCWSRSTSLICKMVKNSPHEPSNILCSMTVNYSSVSIFNEPH